MQIGNLSNDEITRIQVPAGDMEQMPRCQQPMRSPDMGDMGLEWLTIAVRVVLERVGYFGPRKDNGRAVGNHTNFWAETRGRLWLGFF